MTKQKKIFIVVPMKNRPRKDVMKDCARVVDKYMKRFGNDNVYATNSIYDQFMRYSMGVLSRLIIDMSKADVVLLVKGCESDFTCTTLVDIAKHYLKKIILEEELDEEESMTREEAQSVTPQQKYALLLDIIRAEIEEQVLESLSDCGDDWFAAEKVNECLEIIDKYKAESE